MEDPPPPTDAELVSELNQLLRLSYDSVAGYTAMIDALEDERAQLALIRHRGDHQRHIVEIAGLIRSYGGEPQPLSEAGERIFDWDAESLRSLGGDREILLAFVADERQLRHAYREHAEQIPLREVGRELRQHLEDEERHCAWAEQSLRRLRTASGRQRSTERIEGRVA